MMRISFNRLLLNIGNDPIDDEFEIEKMSDDELNIVRDNHMKKKPTPYHRDNAGVTFFISAIGFPFMLILGALKRDEVYLCASIFWLVVFLALYAYLYFCAKYWREHYTIMQEDMKRYGRTFFS